MSHLFDKSLLCKAEPPRRKASLFGSQRYHLFRSQPNTQTSRVQENPGPIVRADSISPACWGWNCKLVFYFPTRFLPGLVAKPHHGGTRFALLKPKNKVG